MHALANFLDLLWLFYFLYILLSGKLNCALLLWTCWVTENLPLIVWLVNISWS